MGDVELTKLLCTILGIVPGWEWREDGPAYTANEVGIWYRTMGADPDRAIAVTVYGGTDPTVYEPQRRAQLHFRGARGDIAGADALADVAFLLLHERPRGQGLSSIARTSFGSLSIDDNRRAERTDNYLITLDNLEASTS